MRHRRRTDSSRRPMRVGLAIVALMIAVATGRAGSGEPTRHGSPSARAGLATAEGWQPAIERGRQILESLRAELEFPGLSVAVRVDGELAWTEGLGLADRERELPMTPGSVLPIYSVSKALTSLTLVRLAEEGLVDLDAPVTEYLETLPAPYREVTVRLLAGHLAGVRHYRPGAGEGTALRHCETASRGLEVFVNDPLVHAPGTDFRYTSYGFVLLSAVLEAAVGEPFPVVMRRYLLDPLELSDTYMGIERGWEPEVASTYEVSDEGVIHPARRLDRSCKMGAGAYWSTAIDVARAADAVLTGGFLRPETRAELFTPQHSAAGEAMVKGIGWDIGAADDGTRWVRHVGGNEDAWSALVALPDSGVSVALLANMQGRDWIHDEALEIARAFRDAKAAAGAGRSVAEPADGAPVLAITGAWVVPMRDDAVLPAHTVVVRDGKVAWLGPDHAAEIPAEAIRIEAGGSYLVPGLVDAHVHAGADASTLLLANGVTTVRRMHGDGDALEWRRAVASGELTGPRVLVAGVLLAGEEVPWPHELVVDTDRARDLVAAQARAGYDFVKPYDGLTPEVYAAIVDEAERQGLPLAGHVPRHVGIRSVLEAGQRTLEHTEKLLYAQYGRDGVMQLPLESLEAIVETMAGSDAYLTPTLAGMERAMRRGTPWHEWLFHESPMRFADPSREEWWSLGRGQPPSFGALQRRRHFLMLQEELTIALHRAGIRILAGTDTPYPLLVPGFSLHDELEKLVAIGLTPREALRAATVHGGEALGIDGLGTIEVGAIADLLLVDGDPLADIGVLRGPEGVIANGRWLGSQAEILAR